MNLWDVITEMWSERAKISSKRVIATLMVVVLCVVIFIWPDKLQLIDAIMFFIAGLIGFSVVNKHKAFKDEEKNK